MENKDPIPSDLLIDILSRVPAKSIARFRCVSKYWSSILGSPYFTELFLTKSLTRPRILFTFEVDDKLVSYSSPQLLNPYEKCSVVATRYNCNTPFPKYVSSLYQTMVCGLVIHKGYFNRKIQEICNPATGEFLTLPKVKARIEGIYFGYDPINKQFKVLCMTSSNIHQVLTLECGKPLWRGIECDFSFRKDNWNIKDICIKGVLYFVNIFQEPYQVVCFDVRSEKFSLINLDTDIHSGYYTCGSTTFVNYKGEIGLLQCRKHFIKGMEFVLWVVQDAKNHKWSKKLYRCPPLWEQIFFENYLHVVGMVGTGETVWSPRRISKVPLYVFYVNLERGTYTKVTIQGCEELKKCKRIGIHTFIDYVENMKLFK